MSVPEDLDVLIIGAGLTGINAAHVLQQELPGTKYAILEGRDIVGGTWSFWKYPGFRCDALMTTFGFDWHPWPHDEHIVDGKLIAKYIEDAMETQGIDKNVRLKHHVVSSSWDSSEHMWTVVVDAEGQEKIFRAPWVMWCMGYYAYDRALETTIPNISEFKGSLVHPQWWPEDLDWAGKRVILIGSGATTWTLFPTMAETAGEITVLQRSPTFVMPLPRVNIFDRFWKRIIPLWMLHWIARSRDLLLETLFVSFLINNPKLGRRLLLWRAKMMLPKKYPAEVDFNPKYEPWQQRLCIAADGDVFKALHKPNAKIVTDHIEAVTSDGIRTRTGKFLPADIIVTATGLHIEFFGKSAVNIDGAPLNIHDHFVWRGSMLEGVPNAGLIMGYVKGSWTPGADAATRIFVKTIKSARAKGAVSAMPYLDEETKRTAERHMPFEATSNYFKSAKERMPVSLNKGPWYGRINIAVDRAALWFGDLTDGMRFEVPEKDKDA